MPFCPLWFSVIKGCQPEFDLLSSAILDFVEKRLNKILRPADPPFDNFDFSRLTGKNIDKLRSLSTLSALYAHKNLAFIGKPETGKTHLAQAFGRACCEHGTKAYFIKMTELRDRMTDARRAGRESTLLAALVRPSCLIIDEVGHCEFDKESTRLFFDMVDRRYQKDGYYNMVFTSNRDPAQWQENFCENDSLLIPFNLVLTERRENTRKPLKTLGKTRVTWYNVCKQIRKF